MFDEDNSRIVLFAGGSGVELDGKEGKIGLAGSISEMHGGDRTEDGLLRRESSFQGLIPSTTFTPVPQLQMNLPIQAVSGLIGDISKMLSLLG